MSEKPNKLDTKKQVSPRVELKKKRQNIWKKPPGGGWVCEGNNPLRQVWFRNW